MIGFIDAGGGMRGVYTAGIYDFLLEENVNIDYGIGVSAGAANMITFFANQIGRTLKFYSDYSFRKEYMSMSNWFKTGSYLDLDYIYTTLTVTGGEYPLDYETFKDTVSPFFILATDASTGQAKYFTREDIALNSYDVLKASCAIPAACKPYPIKGNLYFDGGVSEPIPFKKAFDDGCDKVVVMVTRTPDYVKPKQKNLPLISYMLRKYPKVIELLKNRHNAYNESVAAVKELEKQGKALLVCPDDCCGVDTLTKDRHAIFKLYEKGQIDAKRILDFI